ncbi:MAG: 7,8-didemethyl-8-hydroxy-5-deazariboflavin synthase subunit CofG [Candidatus Hydrothermarchaeales archaeon]
MKPITTFSKNIFIPLTNACHNNCAYCTYRSESPTIMDRDSVLGLLKKGAVARCTEALFTFGEKPEVYPEIKQRLEDWGYSTVIEYLHDLCLDAINLGLLPHSNPGSVTGRDLEMLRDVNASMGLMLESSSRRLCEPGMAHEKSPGKHPRIRLRVLEEAGRLEIPFTTGVLIGIGETDSEVVDSLAAIREINDRYGHIQELIIQNFRPKPGTVMADLPEPSLERVISALETAKEMFPEIGLQVPPNLNPGREGVFLRHGANDFGGVSPITPDFVNPCDQWPTVERLQSIAAEQGFMLRERLPVYPKFLDLVPERLKTLAASIASEDGFVR